MLRVRGVRMVVIPRCIGFIPNLCADIALDCHLDRYSMCEKLPAHGKVLKTQTVTSGQLKARPAMKNECRLQTNPISPLFSVCWYTKGGSGAAPAAGTE